MKYILYCRKSTDTEDKQVLSLDSQQKELTDLAKKDDIKIIQILTEKKSAKEPGRPIFNEMIKMIQAGKADAILCWKIDRLTRNPVDGGQIQWLLQNNKIKCIQTFEKSYFPPELNGYYLAGDGAQCDVDGCFWIMGRIDDVLNVSGHRLGTMEVESALVSHELVAEAAVVGRPDATTGEAVVAFVVLKRTRPEGDEAVAIGKQLRDWVAKEIGPIAKPKEIRFGDNLPKTRSGKIMRRLLRVVAKGEAVTQDVSTLENPAILDQLSKPV